MSESKEALIEKVISNGHLYTREQLLESDLKTLKQLAAKNLRDDFDIKDFYLEPYDAIKNLAKIDIIDKILNFNTDKYKKDNLISKTEDQLISIYIHEDQFKIPDSQFTQVVKNTDGSLSFKSPNGNLSKIELSTKKKDVFTDDKELYNKSSFTALELFKLQRRELPTLVEPFFQTVGLASIVGGSDVGKSTFLRQLALSIALDLKEFSGFKLNCKTNEVIYVSTEDDPNLISSSIIKQISHLKIANPKINIDDLKRIEFIFDTTNLFEELDKKLSNKKAELVVIDAFSDVFNGEINANTQVRQFLNMYDQLAKKHHCLFVFLHHVGKGTEFKKVSKNSIIGSQAYEAKMRSVIELRANKNNTDIDLWILKANFLDKSYKSKGYVLKFNKALIFQYSGKRDNGLFTKSDNKELVDKVMGLHEKGMSLRSIEKELKDTDYQVSKTTIDSIIKKNKGNK